MKHLVAAIELGPKWLEEVLAIVDLKDEVGQVGKKRQAVLEKLRRMAKTYRDGLFADDEYHRQKKLLEMELESLVVPEANAAEEAGKLIMDLPSLWASATPEEQHRLLLTVLDAVYVDAKQSKRVVAIRPKPPFRPIMQVAASREGSDVRIVNEPLDGSSVFLVETGESRTRNEPDTSAQSGHSGGLHELLAGGSADSSTLGLNPDPSFLLSRFLDQLTALGETAQLMRRALDGNGHRPDQHPQPRSRRDIGVTRAANGQHPRGSSRGPAKPD